MMAMVLNSVIVISSNAVTKLMNMNLLMIAKAENRSSIVFRSKA